MAADFQYALQAATPGRSAARRDRPGHLWLPQPGSLWLPRTDALCRDLRARAAQRTDLPSGLVEATPVLCGECPAAMSGVYHGR